MSAAVLLSLTALIKVISALGSAPILEVREPILYLKYRYVLVSVAVVELGVVFMCCSRLNVLLKVCAVAWLATMFVLYRIGLLWVGYDYPCRCLGNVLDGLGLSASAGDWVAKMILAYLLCGSYFGLYHLSSCRCSRRAIVRRDV